MPKMITLLQALFIAFPAFIYGGTIHVPSDQSTIQLAIDAASDGDTILVERGRYYENINFNGKKIVLASRFLFTADTEDIDSTIIDGSNPVDSDTATVVLFIHGENPSSVLTGFTITGGTGTAWKDEHSPGTFREGGGILCAFTSPTIMYNVIVGNSATNDAGLASAGGGGIRCGDGSPLILNNVIMYNKGKYGAGVVVNYSAAIIRNNVIFRNSGGEDFGGGGIWINQNAGGTKIIENNMIYENSSMMDGGGLHIDNSPFTVRNNIIWGNAGSTDPQISNSSSSSFTYNDIQGGWTGTGNINADPKFIDTSCYLALNSPCIDAGNAGVSFNDPGDTLNPGFALWPSLGGIRNDMGAYGGPGRSATVYFDLHLDDPLPPSSVSAYSDYQTPTSILLAWNDPTQRRNGLPLSAFTIHIYRDNLYVASVDSGARMFIDSNLVQHQHHTYEFLTSIVNDSSTFDSAGAYAGGHAQPLPPYSFGVLDGDSGVLLSWTNPTRQIDNTPLNDIAAIMIYRDGELIDSMTQSPADTGQQRSYLDVIEGYHYYRLRLKDNEAPSHYSVFTDSLLGYGGLQTEFEEGFEDGKGKGLGTGTWDSTGTRAYSGKFSLSDSPGGDYSPASATSFMLPPVILNGDMVLEYHDIAIVAPLSHAIVQISNNQRRTFRALKDYNWYLHSEWADGSADSADWATERFNLSAYTGDTVTIRFLLVTSGLAPFDGWYIDSVSVRELAPTTTIEFVNAPGWNLLSLPLAVNDGRRGVVYPQSLPSAFSFEGRYEVEDSLRIGKGYWVKFDSVVSTQITGNIFPVDTAIVDPGWNMIGTLSFDFDSSAIRTVPSGILSSRYYEYDGQYHPVQTLHPGRGYWIKASQAGKLILTTLTPSPIAIPTGQPAEGLRGALSMLRFTDHVGHHGDLWFSEAQAGESAWEGYEAPPPPPEGGFDIRFSNNFFLAVANTAGDKEFPIVMQSVRYPLTIEWKRAENAGSAQWQLRSDSSSTLLNVEGKIRLDGASRLLLKLAGGDDAQRPLSYGLQQNYPNPFNPSTIISYQLPVDSRVSIRLYNLLGQVVSTLVEGVQKAGFKTVEWDVRTFSGGQLSSGVYFYRMEAVGTENRSGNYNSTMKLLLIR